MRRLFEAVRTRLTEFVQQRDEALLVVRCNDGDAAVVLRVLQELDELDSSNLYWLFGDPFERPERYVETVLQRFEERHRIVCESLEKARRSPWPPIPSGLRKPGPSPAARMRELIEFARSLLPSGPEFRVVWAPFPTKVGDSAGLGQLLEELLRSEGSRPWNHHVRMVARDDAAGQAVRQRLEKTPRVGWYEPDLGVKAQEQSLEDDVNDESVPLGARMQSLFLLAGVDYAHRRFADALAKYEVLREYYTTQGEDTMLALVLNGMGEVHQRAEDLPRAKAHYESALTPAIRSESPPVLLNVTLSLANLMLVAKSWPDGESYYDSAEKIATAQRNAPTKIHCLENRGVCQDMQGNVRGAAETWETGATLAKAVEEPELRRRLLERLRTLYDKHGQRDRKSAVERQLAELKVTA